MYYNWELWLIAVSFGLAVLVCVISIASMGVGTLTIVGYCAGSIAIGLIFHWLGEALR